jgi:hypothetical protein
MDDDKLEQALEKCVSKETKKTKTKRKKVVPWSKVYEQLREEDLKKKGYIK